VSESSHLLQEAQAIMILLRLNLQLFTAPFFSFVVSSPGPSQLHEH
jgi:hypothetical protein